ncbi:MAG: cupin domain-containing protein [Gloeocapsa sp. DLM2.Bin57]|nr:MAG: cupin domain-containing protein [Gloeocapsa sp. DLM2.Bin57]
MTKEEIIASLNLVKHIEGGYFAETYRAVEQIPTERSGNLRNMCTSIYYLLTRDQPVNHFQKNRSDIIHYFHTGAAITYLIIDPEGRLEKVKLGSNLAAGEQLQLLVKAGCWKAGFLETGDYGLIGEAVAPGFDYRDMEIADQSLLTQYPHLAPEIKDYLNHNQG